MGNLEEMNSKQWTISQLYIESRRNRKYRPLTRNETEPITKQTDKQKTPNKSPGPDDFTLHRWILSNT